MWVFSVSPEKVHGCSKRQQKQQEKQGVKVTATSHLLYLWCMVRCCSDHSSSFWQATGRGAWPPCACPHTSTRCREPGWRGPEPEWSRSGRAGSESDGTCAPAWPRGRGGSAGGVTRDTEGQRGHKVWLQSQMEPKGRDRCFGGDFKSWRIAKFKHTAKTNVM